jgi:hypothetical protein
MRKRSAFHHDFGINGLLAAVRIGRPGDRHAFNRDTAFPLKRLVQLFGKLFALLPLVGPPILPILRVHLHILNTIDLPSRRRSPQQMNGRLQNVTVLFNAHVGDGSVTVDPHPANMVGNAALLLPGVSAICLRPRNFDNLAAAECEKLESGRPISRFSRRR